MKIQDDMETSRMLKKLIVILGYISIAGCVTTSIFASEYRQKYVLVNEEVAYSCEKFTGQWSVLVGGPEKVLCFESPRSPTEVGIPFPRGSVVRVQKLFRIGAIDAFYDEARVGVVHPETGVEHVVYADWPALSKRLAKVK